MNYELIFIHWAPDVVALHLGPLAIRWYSLCWLIGLTLAYLIVKRLYKEAGITSEKFEPLFLYCFMGILIGARLGHCIFYEPGYFLTSAQGVIEMFLPLRLEPEAAPMLSAPSLLFRGYWHFIGYEGLASHGGTFGLMLTLWLYCRNWNMPKLQLLDFIAIATPVTACFIRLGNLFNSEIVGKITDVPWAFVFENIPYHGTEPRHPGQLYEAMAYFLLFFIGWYLYRRFPRRAGSGYFFGLCLTYIFTFRFFIEYVKENQVGFENGMPFNMGQLLSVPFIIIGVYFLHRGLKADKTQ